MVRYVWIWFLVAGVVVLNAALGSFNIDRMSDSEKLLLRTRTMQSDFDDLLSDLKDAETGHRGYLITGDPPFLKPYREAEALVPKRLERLRDETQGNPSLQDRLAAMEKLIAAKFAEMRATIAIRDAQGLAAAAEAVSK